MGIESFTEREIREMKLAFYYAVNPHGTDGHNRLLLFVKLASALGFSYNASLNRMFIPEGTPVRIGSGADSYMTTALEYI